MSPEQKIKHLILIKVAQWRDEEPPTGVPEEIDAQYEALVEADEHWDAMNEVRSGEAETGVKCEWSRHYESKAVAAKYIDGSWVGWTYWFGGGKHGEPEAVDWMDEAYDLDVTEEEKLVVVRTFSKVEGRAA